LNRCNLDPDGVQNLCAAIVRLAVIDYRTALQKMALSDEVPGSDAQKRKYKAELYQEIMELQYFFHSEWFEFLSDADGPTLQKRVEEALRSELRQKMIAAQKRKEKAQMKVGADKTESLVADQ